MKKINYFIPFYFIALFISQFFSLLINSLYRTNNAVIFNFLGFGLCINHDYSAFLGRNIFWVEYNNIYIIMSLFIFLCSAISINFLSTNKIGYAYKPISFGLAFCSIGLLSNSLNLYDYGYVINYLFIKIGSHYIATNIADILMYIGGFILLGALINLLFKHEKAPQKVLPL